MKLHEFQYDFPNADMSMFKEVDGAVCWGKYNDDVEEPAFWQNDEAVFDLHLDFNASVSYYQDKNGFFKRFKARKAYHEVQKKIKSNFPVEWSYKKDMDVDIKLKTNDIDFENFRIYINDSPSGFFILKDTLPDFGAVDKIDWKDSKNVYVLSLKAMYVLSCLGGMSLENLKSENAIARSLAHFYFYYHLKKFYNYRDFSGYDFSPLQKMGWNLYHIAHHFVWYHSQIHYDAENLKRTKDDIIENIHRDGNKLKYDVRMGKRDVSKDYLKLIQEKGEGLTDIGRRLLQESNQAYVYCVLGSQAKTRWKIVGDGANSLQTQQIFKSLVDEIVSENNLSLLIKSMRLAVSQTKVRLDFVIGVGLEILPSNMLYLKDSPGYNNVLKVSSGNLKFGENISVNSVQKKIEEKDKTALKPVETGLAIKNPVKSETIPILFSGALIAVLARIAWISFL